MHQIGAEMCGEPPPECRLCLPEYTPHFLFETPKRKCAVHGGKEKVFGMSWPQRGQLTQNERPAATHCHAGPNPTCQLRRQMFLEELHPLALHGNALLREQKNYTVSPYSAQVLLSVTFTSMNCPISSLPPFRRTSRFPSVREARGKFSSSLSPSTSTRTVLPT